MKNIKVLLGILTSLSIIAVMILMTTNVTLTQDNSSGGGEDQYAQGCVSCHVEKDGVDFRISTLLAKNHKKHPKVKAMKQIPKDCAKCHKEGKKFGALGVVIHKVHFQNPETNKFVTDNGGNCNACHIMNPETWKSENKQGPKNW